MRSSSVVVDLYDRPYLLVVTTWYVYELIPPYCIDNVNWEIRTLAQL